MFDINCGETIKVSYAREGKHQDGTPYAVICCYEKDNQDGIENPSKSMDSVKIWLDKLPAGVVDGCLLRIKSISGIRKVSEKNTWNGKDIWRTALNIKGELEVIK